VNASGQIVSTRQKRMDPTYLLMTLPGETDQSFLILQPFVPVSVSDKQQNLTAFMTAKSDPSNYGKLEVFATQPGQVVDGPALINSAIQSNTDISKEITLLNSNGSKVNLGNVIVVPINQSLIYVQPLYVEAAANPVPRLADVIMVYNKQAYHGANLNAALCQLPFGQAFCFQPGGTAPEPGTATTGTGTGGTAASPSTPSTTAPSTTTPTTAAPSNQTVQQLLTSAQTHFQNAQNALKAGDLATYQTEVNAAQADVNKAQQQSGGAATSPTSTPPSTTGP
jgi:uncharacterized membrane protein (UPF0182 family)